MQKLLLVILVAFTLNFLSCASMRKIDAAMVLKQCTPEFKEFKVHSIDISAEIIPENIKNLSPVMGAFTLLPLLQQIMAGEIIKPLGAVTIDLALNIRNKSQDTLWLDSAFGSVALDSIVTSQWHISKPTLIVPGDSNIVQAYAKLPIDTKLLKILEANDLKLAGILRVKTSTNQEPVNLDFAMNQPAPTQEIQEALEFIKGQAIVFIKDYFKAK